MIKLKINHKMVEIKTFFKDLPNTYFVGGCVRDLIMNKTPTDYDLATKCLPDEVEKYIKLKNKRPYKIGKKFGTIGVKIENELVEITTFRKEEYFNSSRKPKVLFTKSLKTDLSRRDFTVNAIAMSFNDTIIDPYNGLKDIDNKIIKSVGSAKKKFKEDPLRILRAVRISNQLNFKIEEKTKNNIVKSRFLLLNLSSERIVDEIEKIFKLKDCDKGLNLLFELCLFNFIIPELSLQYNFNQESPYHTLKLHDHTIIVVKSLRNKINTQTEYFYEKMWTALLHDIGKPFTKIKNKKGYSNYIFHDLLGAKIANNICKNLNFSNKKRKFIVNNINNHLSDTCWLRKYDNLAK